MSDVTDLSEAREARRMGELLSQLDEALTAAQIDVSDPRDSLGRAFAIVRFGFERMDAMLREDRAHRLKTAAALAARQLRLIAEAREVAETYQATAKAELAKMDRMARKAETDLERKKLAVQDSILATLEQVTPQIVAGVKEASVIRVKAFNRALYVRHVAAGIAVVLLVLGLAFGLGRLSKGGPLPVEASSQSDSQ